MYFIFLHFWNIKLILEKITEYYIIKPNIFIFLLINNNDKNVFYIGILLLNVNDKILNSRYLENTMSSSRVHRVNLTFLDTWLSHSIAITLLL